MKRSQITLYVALGVVLVIILGIFLYFVSKNSELFFVRDIKNTIELSGVRMDISNYVNLCIKHSVEESIQDTGIRLETVDSYKSIVTTKIKECTAVFFNQLREQNYEITEKDILMTVDISPETLTVIIKYPVEIIRSGIKVGLSDFEYTFDRAVTIDVPSGIAEEEIRLVSANGKAELVIPKGAKLFDENGKPVEKVGIRVDDRHFDGLNNKYVLGELVYDLFPDGTRFSEPAQFSIDFRESDIPPGYSKDNIRIGYWNEKEGIWYAGDTSIDGERSTSNITHFSTRADLLGYMNVKVHRVFEQRYYPWGVDRPYGGGSTWNIGGIEKKKIEGPASLVKPETKESLIDFRETIEKHKGDGLISPMVRYGYFVDEEGHFVDCENPNGDNKNIDGQIYKLMEGTDQFDHNNNPYFFQLGGYSLPCNQEVCLAGDEKTLMCKGKKYLVTNSDETTCMPSRNGKEDGIVYSPSENDDNLCCLPVSTDKIIEEQLKSDENYLFGWHNFQCAGGMVSPDIEKNGIDASDLLIFRPNGDAVVFSNPLDWFSSEDLPKIEVQTLPFDIKWNNIDDRAYKDMLIVLQDDVDLENIAGIKGGIDEEKPQYNKNLDGVIFGSLSTEFVCELNAYDNGDNTYTEFKKINSISEDQKKQITEHLGEISTFSNNNFPVYGINEVKIIKKPKKDQLQAYCDVVWYFWGNGVVDYYPKYPNEADKDFKVSSIEQFCIRNFNDERCSDFKKDFEELTLLEFCNKYPDDSTCEFCMKSTNANRHLEVCNKNEKEIYCEFNTHQNPKCSDMLFEKQNIITFCMSHEEDSRCDEYIYDFVDLNLQAYCEKYPDDSVCTYCAEQPDLCNGDDLKFKENDALPKNDPNKMKLAKFCEVNPGSATCAKIKFCQTTPDGRPKKPMCLRYSY